MQKNLILIKLQLQQKKKNYRHCPGNFQKIFKVAIFKKSCTCSLEIFSFLKLLMKKKKNTGNRLFLLVILNILLISIAVSLIDCKHANIG